MEKEIKKGVAAMPQEARGISANVKPGFIAKIIEMNKNLKDPNLRPHVDADGNITLKPLQPITKKD